MCSIAIKRKTKTCYNRKKSTLQSQENVALQANVRQKYATIAKKPCYNRKKM